MKFYLGDVGQILSPKNKLEKAIQDFINCYDRVIINATHIEVAKTAITNRIKLLTASYPKCTPIEARWWTPDKFNEEVKDWVIGGVDCVRFSFMCSKEFEG